jgi:hypothetical protein
MDEPVVIICARAEDRDFYGELGMRVRLMAEGVEVGAVEGACDFCDAAVIWDGKPPPTEGEIMLMCSRCFAARGGFQTGDSINLTPNTEAVIQALGWDAEQVKAFLPWLLERRFGPGFESE